MRKKIESLQSKLVDSVDELEQYSRRNCLLLHGARESEDENANNVIIKTDKEKMYVHMREEDLDRTHYVGNTKLSKEGKPRPNYEIC